MLVPLIASVWRFNTRLNKLIKYQYKCIQNDQRSPPPLPTQYLSIDTYTIVQSEGIPLSPKHTHVLSKHVHNRARWSSPPWWCTGTPWAWQSRCCQSWWCRSWAPPSHACSSRCSSDSGTPRTSCRRLDKVVCCPRLLDLHPLQTAHNQEWYNRIDVLIKKYSIYIYMLQ